MSKKEMKNLLESMHEFESLVNEDYADSVELEEIGQEIKELVKRAANIVRSSGNQMAYERARRYWIPHILGAIENDRDGGGSMFTLMMTAKELEDEGYERNEE